MIIVSISGKTDAGSGWFLVDACYEPHDADDALGAGNLLIDSVPVR